MNNFLVIYSFLTTILSDSGEDIAETETEDSSEFDYDDNDDDFIDDDDAELFAPSPVPNSGGRIWCLWNMCIHSLCTCCYCVVCVKKGVYFLFNAFSASMIYTFVLGTKSEC